MLLPSFELYAPTFALSELNEHKATVIKKFKLSETQFLFCINLMKNIVEFVDIKKYAKYLAVAKTITPDPDDIDFFALALKLDCPIWSNDKLLKKQARIKVFSTADLIQRLEL